MKCPCEECISFAICVNTSGSGCELTDQYIGMLSELTSINYNLRIVEVRNCLKMDYCFVYDSEIRFYHNRARRGRIYHA